MIRINLLPYRVKLRQRQIIFHIACFLIIVAATIVLCGAANVYEAMVLDDRHETIKKLDQKLKKLDEKIGTLKELDGAREEVQGKLKIVDELQVGQFRSLNVLVELSRKIPKNVWIRSLQDGGKGMPILIKGRSGTSQGISEFMHALSDSDYFDGNSIHLGRVNRSLQKKIPIRTFDIKVKFGELASKEKAKK